MKTAGGAAFLALMAFGAPALALDGTQSPASAPVKPGALFATPQQAFRQGFEAYRSGDVQTSLPALKYAAENGHPLAQWKLGKMYADGDGVPHDDLKAFQYFSRIVEDFDDDDAAAGRRDLSVVANAFVAVGVYSLNGIAAGRVKPDPQRALQVFHYAATNFGDANAQYNLARMYLDGAAVARNVGQAVRWLNLAAEKQHHQAQALLGHILFSGEGGVARQRARGLMWLSLARQSADPAKDRWIVEAYETAQKSASDLDRDASRLYVERRLKKRD
ncbi:MAG: sel1 repeat family protein [Methylobacteriaceae bacterium]|nr:sel1 repeat family protein [Methylobacteriaceae bacterium]